METNVFFSVNYARSSPYSSLPLWPQGGDSKLQGAVHAIFPSWLPLQVLQVFWDGSNLCYEKVQEKMPQGSTCQVPRDCVKHQTSRQCPVMVFSPPLSAKPSLASANPPATALTLFPLFAAWPAQAQEVHLLNNVLRALLVLGSLRALLRSPVTPFPPPQPIVLRVGAS